MDTPTRELATYISGRIKEFVNKACFTRENLIKLIAEETGWNEAYISSYLTYVTRGYSNEILPTPHSKGGRLEKLATLINFFPVAEDDEMILRINQLYPEFTYPPKQRKPYKEISLEDNLKQLKPSDLEFVKKLIHTIVKKYY